MTDGANMNTMSDGIMKKNEMAIPTDYQAIYMRLTATVTVLCFIVLFHVKVLHFLASIRFQKLGFI